MMEHFEKLDRYMDRVMEAAVIACCDARARKENAAFQELCEYLFYIDPGSMRGAIRFVRNITLSEAEDRLLPDRDIGYIQDILEKGKFTKRADKTADEWVPKIISAAAITFYLVGDGAVKERYQELLKLLCIEYPDAFKETIEYLQKKKIKVTDELSIPIIDRITYRTIIEISKI